MWISQCCTVPEKDEQCHEVNGGLKFTIDFI